MEPREIQIQGAREHNLKGVDVSIPRERFVVITGPSGSGKSSLAKDTLYAEGHRRYVECLSAEARQYLQQVRKPAVDRIDVDQLVKRLDARSRYPLEESFVVQPGVQDGRHQDGR